MVNYFIKFFDFLLPHRLTHFIKSRFGDGRVHQENASTARVHEADLVIEVDDVSLDQHRIEQVDLDAARVMEAVQKGDLGTLKHLLELEHIDPNQPDVKGMRPLFAAIDQNNYAMVQLLVRCERINLLFKNGDGRTIRSFIDPNETTYNRQLVPLLINAPVLGIRHPQYQHSSNHADLKSARYLNQMAVLFPLTPITDQKHFDRSRFLLQAVKNPSASPDRCWHALEQAWEAISLHQPDYFQPAIRDLQKAIQTGAVSDACQIADHIEKNQPVSFLVLRPDHVMSISICHDRLIFTNLGGSLDLHTGKIGDNSSFTGKRIIKLDAKSKAALTPVFLQSLMDGNPKALKAIFELLVQGVISHMGQKRGNCASEHPKSIWEDRLLFAQAQQIDPDQPSLAWDKLFEDKPSHFRVIELINNYCVRLIKDLYPNENPSLVSNLDEAMEFIQKYQAKLPIELGLAIKAKIKLLKDVSYPVILAEDLKDSDFLPSYATFKQLTLTAREQALAVFKDDPHAIPFLAQQFLMSRGLKQDEAIQLAQDMFNQIIEEAHITLKHMKDKRSVFYS